MVELQFDTHDMERKWSLFNYVECVLPARANYRFGESLDKTIVVVDNKNAIFFKPMVSRYVKLCVKIWLKTGL